MIDTALGSDLFSLELATVLLWIVNAAWVAVALYGLIAHRSLTAAYAFAAIWALTLCLHIAVPVLTEHNLSLVDSFFLLAVVATCAQVILEVFGAIGAAFGFAKSRDNEQWRTRAAPGTPAGDRRPGTKHVRRRERVRCVFGSPPSILIIRCEMQIR